MSKKYQRMSNFEKLSSDEKMLILMKLSSSEIVKVCETSKDLSRVCYDARYNPLWYKKIREEFNIDYKGKNGYLEYKRLYSVYKTPTYIVQIKSVYANIAETYNFSSIEKAKDFLKMYFKDYLEENRAFLEEDNPYVLNFENNYNESMNLIDDLEVDIPEDINGRYFKITESYLDDAFSIYLENSRKLRENIIKLSENIIKFGENLRNNEDIEDE